jgi:hypothetical protein
MNYYIVTLVTVFDKSKSERNWERVDVECIKSRFANDAIVYLQNKIRQELEGCNETFTYFKFSGCKDYRELSFIDEFVELESQKGNNK